MTPAAISLAATMGYDTLPVRTKLRVAVISTGDELVQPGVELNPAKSTNPIPMACVPCWRRLVANPFSMTLSKIHLMGYGRHSMDAIVI